MYMLSFFFKPVTITFSFERAESQVKHFILIFLDSVIVEFEWLGWKNVHNNSSISSLWELYLLLGHLKKSYQLHLSV